METTTGAAGTEEARNLWKVCFTNAAVKQRNKLPKAIGARLLLLATEMETEGPIQPEWHHYGKLTGTDDT
ncbi:MAG: hypothetical protein LBC14_05300, partial [Desulfovibrio sp.]|nr:hypothetical protein [Desulfovibrio sp.]